MSFAPSAIPVPRRSWRLEVAVASGMALGQLGAIVQPYLVGTLVDGFHRSPAEAGYMLGAQMACYSISLLIIARFVDRLPLAQTAIFGAALSVMSGLFVLWGDSNLMLYLATCTSGIGQGIVFATALAAASYSAQPERLLGIAATIALVVDGAIMAAIPYAQAAWGPISYFIMLSGASLVIGLGLSQMYRGSILESLKVASRVAPVQAALLISMLVLFGVGSGAIYAFVERVAKTAGIQPDIAGVVLMLSLLVGATGSAAAAWLNLKWGRAIPLYLSLLVVGASSLTLTLSNGLTDYVVSICIFQIAYTFSFPYLVGASIYLDATGKLAALTGGIIFLASSVGAAVAGEIASRFSYFALGMFALLTCALACLPVRPIVKARAEPALVPEPSV
jgi:predicted MFS family arabinose efflux permease